MRVSLLASSLGDALLEEAILKRSRRLCTLSYSQNEYEEEPRMVKFFHNRISRTCSNVSLHGPRSGSRPNSVLKMRIRSSLDLMTKELDSEEVDGELTDSSFIQ